MFAPHRLPIACLACALASLSTLIGQVEIIPSLSLAETKIPIFQGNHRSLECANFRIQIEYESPHEATLQLGPRHRIPLPPGAHSLDVSHARSGMASPVIDARIDRKPIKVVSSNTLSDELSFNSDGSEFRMDQDFTLSLEFDALDDGILISRTAADGNWSPGAKALYLRDSQIFYEVFDTGVISRQIRNPSGPHHLMLTSKNRIIEAWLDGRRMTKPASLHAPDDPSHKFQIGIGPQKLAPAIANGKIHKLRFWNQAAPGHGDLDLGKPSTPPSAPAFEWKSPDFKETFSGRGQPGAVIPVSLDAPTGFTIKAAWAQALEPVDHARWISRWDRRAFTSGETIYKTLCATCHGDQHKPGSMPTSRKLHSEDLRNGTDPYRLYQTLHKGYGQMPPMPQLSAQEKYDVIHYLREAVFKPHNPKAYEEVTQAYLKDLPRPLPEPKSFRNAKRDTKPYLAMDYGPSLMGTYQVNRGAKHDQWNIACKGIAIRLDPGPGGVAKGNSWAIYDMDTMRLASVHEERFIDWRSIAFDGSHGTHPSIAGNPLLIHSNTPTWQHPTKRSWQDERLIGRDGKPYGPLPKSWLQYLGVYHHADKVILSYQVGDAHILESAGRLPDTENLIMTRSLQVGKSSHDLVNKLAGTDAKLTISHKGPPGVTIERKEDGTYLHIPAASTPAKILIAHAPANESLDLPDPEDLSAFTKGGPSRFPETITTSGTMGSNEGAFAFDSLTLPDQEQNPWHSWMRVGGFDFYPDRPDRAALCTWYGDVWLVDGISANLEELKWRRICTGLFQPLGLKIVGGKIHVTCRNQLARLHDLNGDEEIDFVECFNHDHQVSENFHEFAMGLQTDEAGNFYYVKGARHARPGLFPHHGTLLRVSPDGATTSIVATGLRAANGVCVNPDGTWMVTDQEGEWCPKNRVNIIKEGGFYGNMLGYHDVKDTSDTAMEEPIVWITNSFDRSPAEPIWIPKTPNWGSMGGKLLNMSYGYGQIHIVPFEKATPQSQGAICALPLQRAPSGLIRGRFHPTNHQLYLAGMIAWSSNCPQDGGFFRVRPTGKPAHVPVATHATKGRYTLTFSDPLPATGSFKVKAWDIQRSGRYGSNHHNERELQITHAEIEGNKLSLHIPELAPTRCMEISCDFEGGVRRLVHATIHQLLDSPEE